MQVRCHVYGLANASSGIECLIDRELLEVGEYFRYRDQDYIIVSVVESQGRWFANVVPEQQRPFVPRRTAARLREGREPDAALEWRTRLQQAERQLELLQAERQHVGERLDRLMHLLELLVKDPEALQRRGR